MLGLCGRWGQGCGGLAPWGGAAGRWERNERLPGREHQGQCHVLAGPQQGAAVQTPCRGHVRIVYGQFGGISHGLACVLPYHVPSPLPPTCFHGAPASCPTQQMLLVNKRRLEAVLAKLLGQGGLDGMDDDDGAGGRGGVRINPFKAKMLKVRQEGRTPWAGVGEG